jgi:hypothetical protein
VRSGGTGWAAVFEVVMPGVYICINRPQVRTDKLPGANPLQGPDLPRASASAGTMPDKSSSPDAQKHKQSLRRVSSPRAQCQIACKVVCSNPTMCAHPLRRPLHPGRPARQCAPPPLIGGTPPLPPPASAPAPLLPLLPAEPRPCRGRGPPGHDVWALSGAQTKQL